MSIPLVMVPGWLDQERNLTWMAAFLRDQGLDTHPIVPRPNNGRAPIELLAQQVANFVEQTFGPEQPINLFGFSMGGLIGRVYIQKLGGQRRVQRFVTVASPHRGHPDGAPLSRPGGAADAPEQRLSGGTQPRPLRPGGHPLYLDLDALRLHDRPGGQF